MTTADIHAEAVRRLRTLTHPLRPWPTAAIPRLPRLPEVRAVLFDFYGTMFISGAGELGVAAADPQPAALAAALKAAGIRASTPDASPTGLVLMRSAIEAERARGRGAGVRHPEVDIRKIWAAVLRELGRRRLTYGRPSPARISRLALDYEARVNPVWPMPGLRMILRRLRARGVVLGVVSNAQFFTPLIFEALLGGPPADWGFDPEACVWSYEWGEAKPSERLVSQALAGCRRRGIAPREVLFVGNDRRNDLAPAARRGCRTALFAGDRRSLRVRSRDPACRGVRPDVILTRWEQLNSVLFPAAQRACAARAARAAARRDSAGQRPMSSSK